MTLSELKKGESGVIEALSDDPDVVKLIEMGCLPGEKVTVQIIAPLGDPIAIEIEDYYILSLRKSEAKKIIVKKLN